MCCLYFKKCNILAVNILKFLILYVLSLVCCRFPNFCVGVLTRDSVQQVVYLNLINLVGSDGNFHCCSAETMETSLYAD